MRDFIHIDTDATIREGLVVPTEPDPAYVARLPELLSLRAVGLPVRGESGPWRLCPPVVGAGLLYAAPGDPRALPVPAGLYTSLRRDGVVWMSDMPPEIWWMREGLDAIADPSSRRVLITGLGLGIIATHALRQPHVRRVDVIERDPDVYRLVRRHLRLGPRLRVHRGDAYALDLRGTWDVAYHDIWPKRTLANIPEYIAMAYRWRGRVGRQLFWPEADLAASARFHGGEEAALWEKFAALRREQGW